MDKKFTLLTILLLSAFVLNVSADWIDFEVRQGTYPFNIYLMDLKANDILSVKLAWNTTTAGPVFDLYLYRDGQNLISDGVFSQKK